MKLIVCIPFHPVMKVWVQQAPIAMTPGWEMFRAKLKQYGVPEPDPQDLECNVYTDHVEWTYHAQSNSRICNN